MSRADEIAETLGKERELIEKRVARLFVLAALMGLNPVEMFVAAIHFSAFALYNLGQAPERGQLTFRAVAEALNRLDQKGTSLDPIGVSAEMVAQGIRNATPPGGVMLLAVDEAVPTVAFKPAVSGWDEKIKEGST